MKILIGCEESQRVCIEFRKLGHEAFSNDIQECSGGYPEWHIQGCIFEAIKMDRWDMLIAFPPCTFLSRAGARFLYPGGKLDQTRYQKGLQAKSFFLKLYHSDIKHVALENPTPLKVFNLPEPSQAIEPYQFGHPYSKRTLLWLKRLPNLRPTELIHNYSPFVKSSKHRGNYQPPKTTSKEWSKTFPGIARAMASQWNRPEWIEQLPLFGGIA